MEMVIYKSLFIYVSLIFIFFVCFFVVLLFHVIVSIIIIILRIKYRSSSDVIATVKLDIIPKLHHFVFSLSNTKFKGNFVLNMHDLDLNMRNEQYISKYIKSLLQNNHI